MPAKLPWTLKRTPNPPPATSALLVAQGLLVVLALDYAASALQSRPSTFSTTLNLLRSHQTFTQAHPSRQHGVRKVPEAGAQH